jgi:aspartate/methionine/tyrosine aminotransferase
VKRLVRREQDAYSVDADALAKIVSEKTGLLVLTNPHAPSGAISDPRELTEVMAVARDQSFYVMCDEIYAEFDRRTMPTLYSVDPERSIVTTSFTKAYGLGGLKLGVALANRETVDGLYTDVLNTVGNSPNLVQAIAAELLSKSKEKLEEHKQKWIRLMKKAEQWLKEKDLEYFPSRAGVTLWVKMPSKDTYKWTCDCTIPRHGLAAVPGTFFLFDSDYKLKRTNMLRLGLGNIRPQGQTLTKALDTLETAMRACKPSLGT